MNKIIIKGRPLAHTPYYDMMGSGARICEVKVFSRAERLGWGGGVCCGMCGAHAGGSWQAPCQAPIEFDFALLARCDYGELM